MGQRSTTEGTTGPSLKALALLIIGALILLIVFAFWSEHGEICDEPQNQKTKHCARYHITLVILWHLGKWLNFYGPAVSAFAAVVMGFFTWRLWVSTNRLWVATDQSANAAQKAAQVAEDTLLVGERPYIFVTNVRFDEPIDPDDFRDPGKQVWTDVVYQLENHGRTPATVTEFCYDSMAAKVLPETPVYHEYCIHRPMRDTYGRDAAKAFSLTFKTQIDGQLLNDIHIGTRELFAYGYVSYDDIFGDVNTVGYCWRYNIFVKKFLPEENDAYNYRKAEKRSN